HQHSRDQREYGDALRREGQIAETGRGQRRGGGGGGRGRWPAADRAGEGRRYPRARPSGAGGGQAPGDQGEQRGRGAEQAELGQYLDAVAVGMVRRDGVGAEVRAGGREGAGARAEYRGLLEDLPGLVPVLAADAAGLGEARGPVA